MPETPIREAAFAALHQALADGGIFIGGVQMRVERNRPADVAPEERPLLVLTDGDHGAEGGSTLEARYLLRAACAGYLDGATEAELARHVNEWHAKVVRAAMRPFGAPAVADIVLPDGITCVRVEEGAFATEPASVVQSDAPLATCTLELLLTVHAPWGNPFIITP
jgi:hypothetical protein